jgi:transcription antitermination factor NusG
MSDQDRCSGMSWLDGFIQLHSSNRVGAKFKIGDKVKVTHIDGNFEGEVLAVNSIDGEFEYAVSNMVFLAWESEMEVQHE